MIDSAKGTALVTGASAGIGAIYADRLARRGYDLVLVARQQQRLESVAAEIAQRTGRKVEALSADLTNPLDVAKVEDVLRANPLIAMLINNAGAGVTAPLIESDIGEISRMITLNVDVLTRLTYAAASAFVGRGSGAIINIASVVAIRPEIFGAVYGGTKAFVLAFSQALNHELAGKGVRVQVVLPGVTATEFWSTTATPLDRIPAEVVMLPADLVDAALAGLDQGELVTLPSLPDIADWNAFERAREALYPNVSRSSPADRYRLACQLAV